MRIVAVVPVVRVEVHHVRHVVPAAQAARVLAHPIESVLPRFFDTGVVYTEENSRNLNNLPDKWAKGRMSRVDGIFTDVLIFDLLENLFKWITKILGNLNIVMSFFILSTALHFLFWHLYPHFSICSGSMNSSRQSSTLTENNLLGI